VFLCVNIAKFEQTGMLCERGRKYSNGHMRVAYRQRDRLRERDKLMHTRIHDSCNVCKCDCNKQSQSVYTQALEETGQKEEPANWRRRLKDGDKEGDKERLRVTPRDRSREGEREVRERDRKERETTKENILVPNPETQSCGQTRRKRQASRIHFPFPIFDYTRRLYTRISRCQECLHYPLMAYGGSVCLSVIVFYVAQVAITARPSRNFAGFPPRGWLLVLSCCLHQCDFPAPCTMGRAPRCVG